VPPAGSGKAVDGEQDPEEDARVRRVEVRERPEEPLVLAAQ
jgi:hypothetical protein